VEDAVAGRFLSLVRQQEQRGRLSPTVERAVGIALAGVDMTDSEQHVRRESPAVQGVIDAFNRLYYEDRGTWRQNRWQGTRIFKCPSDLWLYQEIVHKVRPGLILETGTAFGGSASYLGSLCDVEGHGRVVSIDISPRPGGQVPHPRVTYITGSSTDPDVVTTIRSLIPSDAAVLVILDSDHSMNHVCRELEIYSEFVTIGSYLIVEDTNVNGHPVHPTFGPGPTEAVDWFLAQRRDFAIDESMHRFHLTLNPRGFLKRLSA
jgi:cephalosporin hydroxylase